MIEQASHVDFMAVAGEQRAAAGGALVHVAYAVRAEHVPALGRHDAPARRLDLHIWWLQYTVLRARNM